MNKLTPAMERVLALPANLAVVAGQGLDADWITGENMPGGYDLNCTGCIWHGIRRDRWPAPGTFEESLAAHAKAQHR